MKKKKNTNLLKKGILLFGLLLTFTNCQKENELLLESSNNKITETELSNKKTSKEQDDIEKAQQWFEQNSELNQFSILDITRIIDWDYAFVTKLNGRVAVEVPLILNEDVNINHKNYNGLKTFNRLLLLPSKDNSHNYISFIVNILQFNSKSNFNNKSSELNYFKLPKNFDGLITVINNENEIIEKNEFKESNIIKPNYASKVLRKDEEKNLEYTCILFGYWNPDGTFEALGILSCFLSGGGTVGGPGYSNPEGENPGSGGPSGSDYSENNGCPPNYIPDPNGDCIPEPVEIINDLTGKALCAYEKLISSGIGNTHNLITELFIEFGDGNIGDNDLTFLMSDDLPINEGAHTFDHPIEEGHYIIKVNSNLLNHRSSIEIASNIVHEIAHASLAKHFDNSNATFQELYNQYINDTGIGNYSHDIMADKLINRMANVLYNYDSSIFPYFDDYKILVSEGVYNLSEVDLELLKQVKTIARNNDSNCK
ncbi:hypothetical protein SAMN06265371_106233 [Lutibacter agarilyticus]|uniref:Uncharacterized protein n=1 Tax=Lutibacter agarilyticus TaxID=1109740 RepID=A0A238XPW4_9FLAO|nr:hypothetical protein [Lutibacter agarilyticus]SNR61015.1 hypothetical protein SAMN06265371_106233 [Lutibacter agarilyticus]